MQSKVLWISSGFFCANAKIIQELHNFMRKTPFFLRVPCQDDVALFFGKACRFDVASRNVPARRVVLTMLPEMLRQGV
jgi:hypothetical protein